MKAYTDIAQSKRLAEILPLESADMWYSYYGNSKYNPTIAYKGEQLFLRQIRNSSHSDIPCWSLAALLSVLPTLDDRNAEFCKDIRYDKWHVYYHSTATLFIIDTERYDNLIDACYELILKLHKLNLL